MAVSGRLVESCLSDHAPLRLRAPVGDSPPVSRGFWGTSSLVLGVAWGALLEHDACDGEQAVGDRPQGSAVRVTSGAQGGVSALAARIMLSGDPCPMVDGASSRATMRSLNAFPYRATLVHPRPSFRSHKHATTVLTKKRGGSLAAFDRNGALTATPQRDRSSVPPLGAASARPKPFSKPSDPSCKAGPSSYRVEQLPVTTLPPIQANWETPSHRTHPFFFI